MPDSEFTGRLDFNQHTRKVPVKTGTTTGWRACEKTDYHGIILYESQRDDSLDRSGVPKKDESCMDGSLDR